jgi:hypothetical protein
MVGCYQAPEMPESQTIQVSIILDLELTVEIIASLQDFRNLDKGLLVKLSASSVSETRLQNRSPFNVRIESLCLQMTCDCCDGVGA